MIVTLSGNNAFELQQKLHTLLQAFSAEHGDVAIERIDAPTIDFGVLQDALTTLPFLATRRLVLIENPAGNTGLGEHLNDLLDNVPETTDVIFVEPKFDKRSVLYKTLKKRTDFHEFNEPNELQLGKWVATYVHEQGGSIKPGAVRGFVQRVGLQQLRLKHELDKLLAYKAEIDDAAVELLVSATPQGSTFDLLEAALAGNAEKALALYANQRKQRVEPQAILALLSWQLHVLAVVKAAGDRSADTIAKESKLNPYVIRKTYGLCRAMTMTNIKELVAQTLQVDKQLKTIGIDADEALQNLILRIAKYS